MHLIFFLFTCSHVDARDAVEELLKHWGRREGETQQWRRRYGSSCLQRTQDACRRTVASAYTYMRLICPTHLAGEHVCLNHREEEEEEEGRKEPLETLSLPFFLLTAHASQIPLYCRRHVYGGWRDAATGASSSRVWSAVFPAVLSNSERHSSISCPAFEEQESRAPKRPLALSQRQPSSMRR